MRLEILMENRGMTLIAPLMFFVSLRGLPEAIKRLERIGILCLLVATLVTLARNDTWNLVILSEAKHLSWIPCYLIPSSYHLYLRFYALLFSSRGTGGLLACTPHYMFESQMPCICYSFVALRQTLH